MFFFFFFRFKKITFGVPSLESRYVREKKNAWLKGLSSTRKVYSRESFFFFSIKREVLFLSSSFFLLFSLSMKQLKRVFGLFVNRVETSFYLSFLISSVKLYLCGHPFRMSERSRKHETRAQRRWANRSRNREITKKKRRLLSFVSVIDFHDF